MNEPNYSEVVEVNVLYTGINQHRSNPDILREIKQAGIRLGHDRVIGIACKVLKEEPTPKELSDALGNAIGVRGISIDDPATSAGTLFQRLYGETEFDRISEQIASDRIKEAGPDGDPIPYDELPAEVKANLRKQFRDKLIIDVLVAKGYKDLLIEKVI